MIIRGFEEKDAEAVSELTTINMEGTAKQKNNGAG